jgi:hypothetical protein
MPVGRARAAAIVAIAAAALVLSLRPTYEPDLWWHLAQGRETAGGQLVRSNVFSATHPADRQAYTPWLFDVGVYGAWQLGGAAGVQLMQASLLALALGLACLAARRRAPPSAVAAWCALAFFAIEPRAIPRPHLVSFVGLAAVLWLIERARAAGRAAPLVGAIPIVALWSNLHVECVFGVALLALFAVVELVRPAALDRRESLRAAGIAGVAALAMLANPYGWGLIEYLLENTRVPAMLDIAELAPPYWPAYRGFFVFVGVAGVLLLAQPKRLTVWDTVLVAGAAALGWRYIRLTPIVAFVAAPVVAARIGAIIERGVDARAVVATAIALAVAASPVPVRHLVTDLDAGPRALEPPAVFSRGAVTFIRTLIKNDTLDGACFNSNNLGGYLIWNLYPAVRVFQDSRLQAYPASHFEAILAAAESQPAWDTLVAGVDWAILSLPRPNRLSGAGRFPNSAWATVYWDEAVEIVIRRTGRHALVASAREYRFLRPGIDPFLVAAGVFGPEGEAIRTEARRQRAENPRGSAGAVVLCMAGDASACADAGIRR